MKTLQINDLLIIDVEIPFTKVSIGTHCIGVKTDEDVEKDTNGFYHIYSNGLFFGRYGIKIEFICKGSELTENIAKYILNTPKQSLWSDLVKFKSLIESKGYYWGENSTEAKTFKLETTLIFKKS